MRCVAALGRAARGYTVCTVWRYTRQCSAASLGRANHGRARGRRRSAWRRRVPRPSTRCGPSASSRTRPQHDARGRLMLPSANRLGRKVARTESKGSIRPTGWAARAARLDWEEWRRSCGIWNGCSGGPLEPLDALRRLSTSLCHLAPLFRSRPSPPLVVPDITAWRCPWRAAASVLLLPQSCLHSVASTQQAVVLYLNQALNDSRRVSSTPVLPAQSPTRVGSCVTARDQHSGGRARHGSATRIGAGAAAVPLISALSMMPGRGIIAMVLG